MDVIGLCVICNRPDRNLNTCWKCGAMVCAAHFNATSGTCVNCSRGNLIGKTAEGTLKTR